MDYRRLRYFVKIIDCGGFRSAADALHIAQPALTRQIQALEADLGVPLLHRSQNGVTMTQQGEILSREAREILARTDALRIRMSPDTTTAKGVVRLGLPSALADLMVGTLVERVSASNPEIKIVCREGAAGLIENVESGSLDLAVASLVSRRARYHCQVDYLLREQDYLVRRAGDNSPAPIVSINDVFALPLILSPMPNARRQKLARTAGHMKVQLNVVAEAATMTAQLNLVLRGLGCAILPYSAAQLMARTTGIAIVPIAAMHSYRALLSNTNSPNPVAAAVVGRTIKQIMVKRDWLR